VTFLAVLAGSSSNSTSSISNVEPGLLGFLIVAALGVALVFILRSMNKQFKKIGPRPEDAEETAGDAREDDSADATPADANRG
jgi:ABC-type sulfate transport system permease component